MNIKSLYDKREISPKEREYLENYHIEQFFRPSVSSDIAAFTIENTETENYRKEEERELKILLVKRGQHPFRGYWALPGGFLQEEESIEECALREIREETNIQPISMKPIGVFSECGRDPRGRIISHAFTSIIHDGTREAVGGDDASQAEWFAISLQEKDGLHYLEMEKDEIRLTAILQEKNHRFGYRQFEILDSCGLAFDHAAIITTALMSLRRDVWDFEMLFDFLPEKFTLNHLQKVQEQILDQPVLTANFRRKIAPLVEETKEHVTGAGHRPARLYTRRKIR